MVGGERQSADCLSGLHPWRLGDLATTRTRDRLTSIDSFAGRFGFAPTHVVHAPGRVNLIGGHIDYHGLSVLPIAIDRGIELFFRPRADSEVHAVSLEPECPDTSFRISRTIPPEGAGHWSNYLRGPAQALAQEGGARRGLDALVASTLPPSVGLSSSSALAVAMGLAVARANDIAVDLESFAVQMAGAERYTGTRGGGMDQAASLLGVDGHALHLHFAPLSIDPVAIPTGAEFLVAHSLETAEKSGSSRADYNDRRRRGEEARRAVAGAFGLPPDIRCRDLLEVDGVLARSGAVLPSPEREYFRHVVTENERVTRAVAAIRSGDLDTLGEMMCASHESLRSEYGVSTGNLDELVSIAMGSCALGARLTGAGFGGAVIVLAENSTIAVVEGALEREFYQPRGVSDPRTSGLLFRVRASSGASVTRLGEKTA